jgi:hypothetical protein
MKQHPCMNVSQVHVALMRVRARLHVLWDPGSTGMRWHHAAATSIGILLHAPPVCTCHCADSACHMVAFTSCHLICHPIYNLWKCSVQRGMLFAASSCMCTWPPQDDAIRNLFSAQTKSEYSVSSLLTFTCMFFLLAVLSYGE